MSEKKSKKPGAARLPKIKPKPLPPSHVGRGRPSLKDKLDPARIGRLYAIGYTDEEVAAIEGVSKRTIQTYKKKPEYLRAIVRACAVADGDVLQATYMRSVGFSIPEVKVFYNTKLNKCHLEVVEKYYPPDKGFAHLWLHNRRNYEQFKGSPDGTPGGDSGGAGYLHEYNEIRRRIEEGEDPETMIIQEDDDDDDDEIEEGGPGNGS